MVRVRRVDMDAAREASRVRDRPWQRVDPGPDHRARRRVSVGRDEHAAGPGRGPQCARVARHAFDDGDHAACTRAVRGTPQVGQARRTNPHEIAAGRIRCRGRKLRAIRLEVVSRTAPILRAPDAVRALEDRAPSCRMRVVDDRGIEVRPLGAGHDRTGRHDPLGRVAVAEVHIRRLAGERVEPKLVVRRAEAGLAAVTIDLLVPDDGGAGVLERPVVLRAALHVVLRPLRADGKALELQRREALVQLDQLIRHAGEQALAVRRGRRVESTDVALVRHVGEAAVRADDAAVRAFPVLERVGRVEHDGVLIGMGELGFMRIAVLRQVAPRRAAVRRQQYRAPIRRPLDLGVTEGTEQVDDVGMARRRLDDVVVPALSGAVVFVLGGRHIREGGIGRSLRVVRAIEARRRTAGGADADVHPRCTAVVRKRELRAVRVVDVVRHVERVLDLRPGRAGIGRAPDAFAEERGIVDRTVVRIDADFVDATRRPQRRGHVGEGRAAIGRFVDPEWHAAGGVGRRATRSDRTDAPHRPCDAGEDVAARRDRQARDRAALELRAASELRPRVSAVGGFVDPHAGLGVGRDVRLAGPRIQRSAGQIVRVTDQRSDRVCREAAGHELPLRVTGQGVLRPPDAAAGRAHIDRAVARHTAGSNRHRRHAACGDVLRAVAEPVEHSGIRGLAGTNQLPRPGRARPCFQRGPRVLRAKRRLHRDFVRRIGALQVRFDARRRIGATFFVGADRRFRVLALRDTARCAFLEDHGLGGATVGWA